jgi:hypothetical protein
VTRTDLLALTPDALAALANRGLVKRAAKELDAGAIPALGTDPDGTVQGKFPDGTTTTLPPNTTLDAARCSCGAAGVCRHRIAVVLTYQRDNESTAPAELWSPGTVTDEDLAALIGERTLRRARRAFQAGYRAKLRHPTEQDQTAQAELPTCTVTFLVPGDLSYVHTDAVNRDEATALAVWAFRAAETPATDTVDVGGSPTTATDLTAVTDLLDQLLLDGATNASEVLDAAWQRLHRDLTAQRLHWPAAVITDLLAQLTAYRTRSAAYDADQFAALLTELHARTTATGPRAEVLGPDEPAETPLKRVRLTALGARLRTATTADIYFASGDVVLVQRDTPLRTGQRLAASNVVSESATRSASRAVTLKTSRVAKTSLTPVGTAWNHLPQALVVDDYAAAAAHLAELPPRQVRARVEAELVRAVRVTEVTDVAYDPAAQRLTATLHHSPIAPDSLAPAAPDAAAEDDLHQRDDTGPADMPHPSALAAQCSAADPSTTAPHPSASATQGPTAAQGTTTPHPSAPAAQGSTAAPATTAPHPSASATQGPTAAQGTTAPHPSASATQGPTAAQGTTAPHPSTSATQGSAATQGTTTPHPSTPAVQGSAADLSTTGRDPSATAAHGSAAGPDTTAPHLSASTHEPAATHDPTATQNHRITCVLEATHRTVAPHSLDALAAALRANPTTITGTISRHRGGLKIDPLAVHTEAGVIIPDLATDTTPQQMPPGRAKTDPLSAEIDSALKVLAEAAHRGLEHLPNGLLTRVREVAANLHRTGLRTAADRLAAFADAPGPGTWLGAHLRLLVTADAR